MVNTVGLDKGDVLCALESAMRCRLVPADKRWPGVYAGIVREEMVLVDLRADDGFDEFWIDRALGHGTAQRAVNKARQQAKASS